MTIAMPTAMPAASFEGELPSRRYSASHWGLYEVHEGRDGPVLRGFGGDPEPTPIGLDQLEPPVMRLRVARPAVRRSWLEKGPGASPELRGREPFVEVGWDEALDLVAGELERVRRQHGNSAIFGGSYGWSSAGRFHHAQSQVHRFLNMIGGHVRHVDTYSLGAGRVIMPFVAGAIDTLHGEHTSWDVMARETKLFVAFGGLPAKNCRVSPGGAGEHGLGGALRQMQAAGTRFVNIGPVRDNLETGGEVEWIPIRPNTDTALMLALIEALVAGGLADETFLSRCCVGWEKLRAYVTGEADGVRRDAGWAEGITGVPAPRIRALAREMAATRTMLNVAFSLQRAEHGEQPFWAVVALASALGQIGLPGGGFGLGYGAMNGIGSAQPKLKGPTLPQGRNPVDAFIPVSRIADMLLRPGDRFTYEGAEHRYPDIRLVYWAGGNPFHHHQDLARLRHAWERPQTIVVHEQYWTTTAKLADVVLPATIALERDDVGFATRERYVVAMRKVAEPFAESRDDFSIFADLAARMGVKEQYTEGRDARQWIEHLYAGCVERSQRQNITLPPFDAFWSQGLLDLVAHRRPVVLMEGFRRNPAGNPLETPSGKIELYSETIAGFGVPDCPGHPAWLPPEEWLGGQAARRWPLHMISDQPARRLHSQLDHSGFSTAGKVDGRERLTISAADAAARGIADGAVVEVANDRGRCLAVATICEAIMPGVVRLSTGAWTDPFVENGPDAHGNPNTLTQDVPASRLSQGCAAQNCLVEVGLPGVAPLAASAHRPPPFAPRG